MSQSSPGESELLARALWLVDNRLLHPGISRTDDLDLEAVLVRLLGSGPGREMAARRGVRSLRDSDPSLVEILRLLCTEIFIPRKGLPHLRPDAPWRRLVRIVDPDVLISAHHEFCPPRDEGFDWAAVPPLQSQATAWLLSEESIETHVHLAGSLPPLFFWIALMGGELPLEVLAKLAPSDCSDGDETERKRSESRWKQAVGRAAWLRLALAERVRRQVRGLPSPFPLLPAPDDRRWRRFREAGASATRLWAVAMELTAPLRIRRRPAKDFQGQGQEQGRTTCRPLFDPLRTDWYDGRRQHYAAGERCLIFHLGRLLREPLRSGEEAERQELEAEMLEYLRTRNALHQALLHDHGSAGLQRFIETCRRHGMLFADRRSRNRRTGRRARVRRAILQLERTRMTAALDAQLGRAFDPFFGHPAAAPRRRLEMRVSVPPGRYLGHTVRAWIEGIADHFRAAGAGGSRSQVGLVFHLLREGSPEKAESRARDEAWRLGNLLTSFPYLPRLIVGIDVAGNERSVPPRAFAGAFHLLRETADRHRPLPGAPPVRLGRTFHVGEDIEDLLTGLRHVHEVATLLLPRDRGRLGHALVLGDRPKAFYKRQQRIKPPGLPRGTHLLDLAWAHGFLSQADEKSYQDYLGWLERLIAERCGLDNADVAGCCQAMRSTGEEACSEQELLCVLGCDPDEPELSRSFVLKPDKQWRRMLAELQRLLRRELTERFVCIEANPTSNLIIGGYSDYHQLPYRRLVDAGFAVSVNTDDPGLFLTSLPGEFAALYEALNQSGKGKKKLDRLRWLGDRIADARASTFLGPQVPFGVEIVNEGVDRFFQLRVEG